MISYYSGVQDFGALAISFQSVIQVGSLALVTRSIDGTLLLFLCCQGVVGGILSDKYWTFKYYI